MNSRTRYNKEHYTQIKAYIAPELATAFKEKCVATNQSQAQVLSKFMREFLELPQEKREPAKIDKATAVKTSVRRDRRTAVMNIVRLLEEVRDAENEYADNIPNEFVNRQEKSQEAVSALDEAINLLLEAFDTQ